MKFLGWELTLARKGAVAPTRFPSPGYVREPYAGAWQRGDTAPDPMGELTQFSAVFACVSRISADVAKLRPRVMQRQKDGTWTQVPRDNAWRRALDRPNAYQNALQLIERWMLTKLLHGNAYALKQREQERGMVVGLHPLDPRRVHPIVTETGAVFYSIGQDDLSRVGTGVVVPASEIVHDRCHTLYHPLLGVSPITACALSATQGRRIQGNATRFFENMSRPSGMLSAPGTIDDVTADRLKSEWEANYSGTNVGRLAVLGDGLKYEAMTIPAADAQLIEQLRFTVEDVCRAFSMPLWKVAAAPPPTTGGGVDSLQLSYYADTLQAHVEALEAALEEGLGLPDGYAVEFDTDNLLRMDFVARASAANAAVGAGVMTPNEARQRVHNLSPIAGGDSAYLQQQNWSLEDLAHRSSVLLPKGIPPSALAKRSLGD